jgi:hypothetical protein
LEKQKKTEIIGTHQKKEGIPARRSTGARFNRRIQQLTQHMSVTGMIIIPSVACLSSWAIEEGS